MRILYVIREFPKLSETFILNEIIELLKLGHDVIIITETCNEKIIQEDITKYDLLNRTIYPFLSKTRGREKAFVFLKKTIIDFIKNPLRTMRILFYTFKLNKNIWVALDSYMSYRTLYNKNIDLIYLTFSYPEGIDKTYFLSKILRVPFVLNFRAYDLYQKKLQKELISRFEVIKKASKIITTSNYNKENIIKKLQIQNINIIYDSIHTERFQSSHTKKDKKVITIARFVPQKGIKYLIEACRILQQHKIDCHCTIIGYGPEEEYYKELIKKYYLHNITITGPLNQEQYKNELDTSAVFVLPCIIDEEGNRDILATVIKEAMAMEIPVITSNICGIDELIDNGVNGILIPPKNSEAIANAIEKILKNPKLIEKMGKAGRKKIKKDFNIKTEIKNLENLFYEVKNQFKNKQKNENSRKFKIKL